MGTFLRLQVFARKAGDDEFVEALTYSFEPMSENTMGDVILEWENTRVKFHLHPGM